MVFAVPVDRMPGSDLIRAASRQDASRELGLGSDRSASGRGSGVVERLVRLPHGLEDDGKLARHRDLRLRSSIDAGID